MMLRISLSFLVMFLLGCTIFSVKMPDGTEIKEIGAPFLNRESQWRAKSWTNDNVTYFGRNTIEDASKQVEVANEFISLLNIVTQSYLNGRFQGMQSLNNSNGCCPNPTPTPVARPTPDWE